jgi:hypothetical protein
VNVDVAASLLARARETGAPSIAVVGASKNAGKTVVIGALIEAIERAQSPLGVCSIGRDGETSDALDGSAKPRVHLRAGAVFATAATLVPRTPALEILSVTGERSALGPIVLARVRAAGFFEIAGPPSAAALRRIVGALGAEGRFVLVDGAVDRTAALRDGADAIVVAVGAATAPALSRALDEVAALTRRLQLPLVDPLRDYVRVEGALTPSLAAAYVRGAEKRQIVVRDPTAVTLRGRTFLELSAQLDLRCERSFNVIGCTVAPMARERSFEPRSFARAVAQRTGLPAYDVYAGTVVEPAAA